ncbi:MAG TPA: hypothetical protein VLB83_01010 [Candidatus Paceibacterota bacterium]|nr:hypothetical protein [Candidatus Paceibacterota bacterium]
MDQSEQRNSTWIIIVLGIVVLGVIGIVVWQKYSAPDEDASFTRTDESMATGTWTTTPATPPAMPAKPKMVITAKHAYRNGEHIIVGSIPLPTSCHLLTQTTSTSTDKKKAFIEFVSTAAKDADKCAQTPPPARFKVTVKADKTAAFSATFNGEEAVLNLIEAGPNENLDNFELYIKG